MNKKAIAILGAIFILIVGTLGFLIYSKYGGKKDTTPTVVPNLPIIPPGPVVGTNATTTPTQQATPKMVRLSQEPVIGPVLFYDGTGVAYFTNEGQLYKADFQTTNGLLQLSNKRSINVQTRPNISKVLWPPSGKNFIAEFDQGSTKTWSFYDSDSGSYTDYPSQVEAVDWVNSTQILYVWVSQGKATLNMADANLKNYKHVADLFETDDDIKVSPSGNNFLFYQTTNTSVNNKITSGTIDGKVWKDMVKDGYNVGALWSPDSQKFLFNKKDFNTQKYQLWYYNLSTGEVKNLELFTTASKAVWGPDSQTVYASVPTSGTIDNNSLTTDQFFRLDTSTLEKKQYEASTTAVDGQNLFLSSDGNKLLFKNGQDGSLYYLDLTQ